MTKEDNGKQALLDLLAKEPTMVLSVAYIYAQNYVRYGEDITKAWTTAVQQASVIQKARQDGWVEAYDSFTKEYEARLKADMVAMLKELKSEIDEMQCLYVDFAHYIKEYDVSNLIQQKINVLKENKGNE